MNRRSFIKWLFSAALAIVGGWLLWLWNGTRQGKSLTVSGPEASSSPSPTPTSTPKPSPSGPPEPGSLLFTAFLFSDLHISTDLPAHTAKLKLALEDVTSFERKPDAVVLGGDLTDFGRESDYSLLRRTFDAYSQKLPPVYGNMGNHDYYHIWLNKEGQFSTETMPNNKTDKQSRERFQKFFNQEKAYHDVWIGDVHLIMLSQEVYVQEKSDVGEGAWYTDEQLAWLEDIMKPHKDGKPALVFIHQPLPSQGTDGATHRLIRAKRFREILAPYSNVFVFSGHTHRDLSDGEHYMKETFHWFTNSSVGRVRAQGGSAESRSQGIYIQVHENAVVIKGREFSNRTWITSADWTVPLVKA